MHRPAAYIYYTYARVYIYTYIRIYVCTYICVCVRSPYLTASGCTSAVNGSRDGGSGGRARERTIAGSHSSPSVLVAHSLAGWLADRSGESGAPPPAKDAAVAAQGALAVGQRRTAVTEDLGACVRVTSAPFISPGRDRRAAARGTRARSLPSGRAARTQNT